jgi:hypothetical protein
VAEGDVLNAVAVLLGVRSGPPDGLQAGVVEAVVAAPTGVDDQVVEDGGDDLLLAS